MRIQPSDISETLRSLFATLILFMSTIPLENLNLKDRLYRKDKYIYNNLQQLQQLCKQELSAGLIHTVIQRSTCQCVPL